MQSGGKIIFENNYIGDDNVPKNRIFYSHKRQDNPIEIAFRDSEIAKAKIENVNYHPINWDSKFTPFQKELFETIHNFLDKINFKFGKIDIEKAKYIGSGAQGLVIDYDNCVIKIYKQTHRTRHATFKNGYIDEELENTNTFYDCGKDDIIKNNPNLVKLYAVIYTKNDKTINYKLTSDTTISTADKEKLQSQVLSISASNYQLADYQLANYTHEGFKPIYANLNSEKKLINDQFFYQNLMFIVMEKMSGDLENLYTTNKTQFKKLGFKILDSVVKNQLYMKSKGNLHNDLQKRNIFYRKNGNNYEIIVGDYGTSTEFDLENLYSHFGFFNNNVVYNISETLYSFLNQHNPKLNYDSIKNKIMEKIRTSEFLNQTEEEVDAFMSNLLSLYEQSISQKYFTKYKINYN